MASSLVLTLLCLLTTASAALKASQDSSFISISNDRLTFAVTKASGTIKTLTLDGQDLLGTGQGPYLDCHCIPGQWTPGGSGATYKLVQGNDTQGIPYAGAIMSHDYQNTGQVLEQYWFLRNGETGLHMFSRAAYNNATIPTGSDLGELRTLFRPGGSNSPWTHLISSDDMYAPLPDTTNAPVVQDATWYVGGDQASSYVQQMSEYFTKYMFSESWRDQLVHGMYADGSKTGGTAFGAWLVMNTKDTYYNGPIHSDLTVDGIVYNYLVSNHHGNGVPTLVNKYDRTFGPQYYYFNKGANSSSLQKLRGDALKLANPEWNAAFYDSIAKHVVGFVPSSGRGAWKGQIALPTGATKPLAVLASNDLDFQDNDNKTEDYQYWANIDASGRVSIPRVKAGTYRLTVYANGIFGQYTQNDVIVKAGATQTTTAVWKPESAGRELWRIGTPDKSSGDFRHGNARNTSSIRQPNQYRLYWAVHDFPTDFPNGVNFKVGRDDPAVGLNYVHWSEFGGKANSIRTEPYYKNVNNWTIAFDLEANAFKNTTKATFTVQLAGAKTSAGNTDEAPGKQWQDLPYTVAVNGQQLPPWTIPADQSSSCAVRSAVSCYTLGTKFVFDSRLLKAGENTLVLSLPYNATAPEDAVLPETTYVQYDALRLEVT